MHVYSEQKSDKKVLNAKLPTGNVLKIRRQILTEFIAQLREREELNTVLNCAIDN